MFFFFVFFNMVQVLSFAFNSCLSKLTVKSFSYLDIIQPHEKDAAKTLPLNVEHERHLIAVSYLQANTCAHPLEFEG